jgi:hypothetical protein
VYGLTLISPPIGEPLTLAEAKLSCRVDVTDDDSLITGLIVAAREMVQARLGAQLVAATWQLSLDSFPTPGALSFWRGGAGLPSAVSGPGRGPWWPGWAVIRLPRSPLQRVLSVQYLDPNGVVQVLDASTYVVSTRDPGQLAPAYGKYWPITRQQPDAVTIQFQAGYGPVTSIPTGVPVNGTRTVTPASMAGIYVGSVLTVDTDAATREQVTVTAVTSTTFTATFAQSHASGCLINCVPETIRTAMRLLVGHWYENREATVVGTTAAELPLAVESLLAMNWNGDYS